MEVKEARSPEEIMLTWEAMHHLRPHLVRDKYLETVEEMMRSGYRLAYVADGGGAPAAMGYRFLHFLLYGRHLYIDDLVTLPSARRRGFARLLLDHASGVAAGQGMTVISLDSGPGRHDAHRLYLNNGFRISSLHFVRSLEAGGTR